jgi:quinohemoprotein ethanol dehydrogenase
VHAPDPKWKYDPNSVNIGLDPMYDGELNAKLQTFVQYISVMAGWGGPPALFNPPGSGPVKPGFGRIVTFTLDGAAKLRALPLSRKSRPDPPIAVSASKQVVHEGELLYTFHCAPCHGLNAVAGPLPDFRYSGKEVMDGIEDIVLRGTRAESGMPSFQKLLNARQLRAIQSYILSRARESAGAAGNPPKP